jgi:rsbT co-antagonist protein RsbR
VTELERSEAKLRSFLAEMDDIVFMTDSEGRYLEIAPTKRKNFYLPPSELIGKKVHEVLPSAVADEFVSNIRIAMDTREPVSMEYSLPIGGGEEWCIGAVLPTADGRALFVARNNTQRKRMEQALRAQQEEIIRAQAQALAELSTPLIPISDAIVVMPLIGVLDSQRAQQVMQTLLTGISERGAEVAILDITGVTVVDTLVANALIQAARAAQLLGAEVVLTGIRPEVARTLVGLGADLTDIPTHGTLQAGIAYAMNQRESSGEEGFDGE